MMVKDTIIRNEQENDGQTVNLYYDALTGMHYAFGWSAYYVTMVSEPLLSFSESLNMPVAILTRNDVLELRQSMPMTERRIKEYYKFQVKERIGDAGYQKWLEKNKFMKT